MITVSRTFAVTPPQPVVLDYLKDFAHAEQWDPGTQSCTRLDDGPIGVGTRWHNRSKVAGRTTELTYQLTEVGADRLVFVGTNDSATSTDTITVVPRGAGSEITYEAVIEMHGVAKLADPLTKILFEKIANDTVRDMTAVLDGLPSA